MGDGDRNGSGDGDGNENGNGNSRAGSHEEIEPADAFAALSDPLRVEILQALAEHERLHPQDPTARFSTLRKACDVRDSGRFRYHLEKLRGIFLEKAAEGYRLTYAGGQVTRAVVAGTYTDRETLGPSELESTCGFCGTQASARYDDGILEVTCAKDHPLFVWALAPNAVEGTTLEEIVGLATTLATHSYELVTDGTCSECYSTVESTIRPVDDGAEVNHGGEETDHDRAATVGQSHRFHAHCDTCGATWDCPVGFVLLGHPEIEALYHRLGRPIRTQYWWELEFVGDGVTLEVLTDEPLSVLLSVELEGAELRASVDEEGHVLDVSRRDGE